MTRLACQLSAACICRNHHTREKGRHCVSFLTHFKFSSSRMTLQVIIKLQLYQLDQRKPFHEKGLRVE